MHGTVVVKYLLLIRLIRVASILRYIDIRIRMEIISSPIELMYTDCINVTQNIISLYLL